MSAPNQLVEFTSPALVKALGWTLLHSLWQGAVLALGASLLLMLLHRHAAAVRYRVSAAALGLLLALAAGTFGYYYRAATASPAAGSSAAFGPGERAPETAAAQVVTEAAALGISAEDRGVGAGPVGNEEARHGGQAPAAAPASIQRAQPTVVAGWLRTGRLYFEQNLPLLVLAWLLGMLAMTLRFLGGLAYVQRLRHYRVAALPAAWQTRLDELARRAGLRRRVRLLASALVPGPLVVGWLRPVVLLPLSAATGLSNEELEAILAHELAHVRRHDYLLNLLQAVAEILFFYHPAVWFLSASLRTERENCCDDLATELCGDPVVLARALAALAALSLTPERAAPQLALAAAGPAGSLLGRVRRLVRPRAEVPTFLEGVGAACVVLAGTAVLVVSTVASLSAAPLPLLKRAAAGLEAALPAKANPAAGDQTGPGAGNSADLMREATASLAASDTLFINAQTNARLLTKSGLSSLTSIPDLTIVVQNEDGDISEVYVDGEQVPAAELPAYRAALARQNRLTRMGANEDQLTPSTPADARRQRMNDRAQRMARQSLAGDTVSDADAEALADEALKLNQNQRQKLQQSRGPELYRPQNQELRKLNSPARSPRDYAYRFRYQQPEVRVDLHGLDNIGADVAGRVRARLLADSSLSAAERRRLDLRLRGLGDEQGHDSDAALRELPRSFPGQLKQTRQNLGQLKELKQTQQSLAAQRAGLERLSGTAIVSNGTAIVSTSENELVAEMQRDGLIDDPENFQFSLSRKELVVNGRRQPAAIHQKYLRLYEDQSDRPLSATGSYSIARSGNSVSVSTNDERTDGRGQRLRGRVMPVPPVPAVPPVPPAPPMAPFGSTTDYGAGYGATARRAEQRRQQQQLQRQRDEAQRREDEQQRRRDEGQRLQDEVQRRRDEAQRQQDERTREEVMTELRRDGLIDADAKSFSLRLRDGQMSVNSQSLPAALAAKYTKLLRLSVKPGQSYQLSVNSD